jgi:hypothetical protein
VYLQCNFSVNIVNKLFILSTSLYNEDNRRTHRSITEGSILPVSGSITEDGILPVSGSITEDGILPVSGSITEGSILSKWVHHRRWYF